MPEIYQKKGSELGIGDTVLLFNRRYTIDAIDWHPGLLVGCKLVPGRAIRSGNFFALILDDAQVKLVQPIKKRFFGRP